MESHNFPPVHILIHQRCPRGMGFLNPVDQKKKEQLKVFSSGKRTEAYRGGTDWCTAFALGSLEPGLEARAQPCLSSTGPSWEETLSRSTSSDLGPNLAAWQFRAKGTPTPRTKSISRPTAAGRP